jgi:aryl-alcohol dehydrogenase-like predicted oxidoreductase
VPLAIDQGIGILVWSPIAGGLLSGKYRRGVAAPPGSRHLTEWNEPPVYDEDKLYDTIEELVAISEELGVSAAQVALAYTMAKPAVTSVIVGARTEEQLADNLAAADLKLTEAHVGRLDKVSTQPLPYPLWHQARNAGERFSPADSTLLSRHAPG